MSLLFYSTLIIIFTISGLTFIINYLVISWESEKVDALTSKIKHTNNSESSILYKSDVSREFTSLDLMKASKASLKSASNIYDRTLVKITSQEYPDWISKLFTQVDRLSKNTWQTLSSWFKYLVSLTKPSSEETKYDKVKAFREKRNIAEIEDFVDKVVEENNLTQNTALAIVEKEEEQEDSIEGKTNSKIENNTATLNLASSTSKNGENKDNGVFERLENRILQKMKDVGLGNYDLWLELGQLYLKYGEKEKAVEVFALVLKHTQNESQKDLARNQLIGLN